MVVGLFVCHFDWHSLATLPHIRSSDTAAVTNRRKLWQHFSLRLVGWPARALRLSGFSSLANKFFTFIYDEDVNLAAYCLCRHVFVFPIACLPASRRWLSVSLSHRRVFHFASRPGKSSLYKKVKHTFGSGNKRC